MKITMIAPFAFQPKATVNARTFPMAQALVARGHQVTILVPPYDNLVEAGRTFERDGVHVRNLALKRVHTLTPLLAARRLAYLARKEHADVVHVFKPIGYAALAGMLLSLSTRVPLVTDSDDWEGGGGWNRINPYPWHWRWFFDFQERWLPRHSQAVTVASRTLETQMWGMGISPNRVFYVPNCPSPGFLLGRSRVREDDRLQVRKELGIGDAPMAVYVGHITRGDDLDLAIDAFARLGDKLPAARLVIVGTGDGLERLTRLVKERRLSESVVFAGWVDHRKVPAYLAAADVALYPYRDSLVNRAKCSIKILEYMAMGKAIVTHRVGQNVEYLENGRSGILAEPGSVDEFADGLEAVLTDRDLARRLGAEAQRRVESTFSWQQRVVDVERAYRAARTGRGEQ
jgi:glycosyltransferase involved in cell wall biosynthesis